MKIISLDFDGTLVYRNPLFGIDKPYTLMYEGAREFLEECREKCDKLVLLSTAHPSYLRSQLNEHGITHFFDRVISTKSPTDKVWASDLTQSSWAHVDDTPTNTVMYGEKLSQFFGCRWDMIPSNAKENWIHFREGENELEDPQDETHGVDYSIILRDIDRVLSVPYTPIYPKPDYDDDDWEPWTPSSP